MNRIVSLVNEMAERLLYLQESEQEIAHILVVEDDENDALLMCHAFRQFGCDVTMRTSAVSAIESIKDRQTKHSDHPYDIVFVDLKLVNGEEGTEVLAHLNAVAPKVPVVVVTGYPHGALIQRASQIGYFGLVAKPLEPLSIRCILQQHRIPYKKTKINERP